MIRQTHLTSSELDECFWGTELQCIYMHLAEAKDRWECEMHTHEELEIGYVFQGTGIYQIGGETYEAHAGDLFVIPPGTPHFETHDADVPFELMFLMIRHDGAGAERLNAFTKEWKGRHSFHRHSRIQTRFEDICREIVAQQAGYLSVIDGILREIYIKLYRKVNDNPSKQIPASWNKSERNRQVLSEIERYVEAHISNSITVELVAQHFFYHPKYLSRLYKEEKGETLAELISSIRLRKAKLLLADTIIPIEQMADLLGLSSIQYVYKWFKKEMGITPLEYRMQISLAPKEPL
ncbi:hypothetical protein SY83_02650 [Paenibacillus swuensis]|uniref:HTH araC/xylS-type domain-containing protein n=1 Tax=Paenibacillus swuensis TaxID=1178515 RepID=A0A172TF43_9BACL|nr:AraC family transcriptional regulator [Paenibacillus swuensis]ANE45403.1 hypothetical protein SY83_02650 [Paenibacillus swuensis]